MHWFYRFGAPHGGQGRRSSAKNKNRPRYSKTHLLVIFPETSDSISCLVLLIFLKEKKLVRFSSVFMLHYMTSLLKLAVNELQASCFDKQTVPLAGNIFNGVVHASLQPF